jgi:hypothetical protein
MILFVPNGPLFMDLYTSLLCKQTITSLNSISLYQSNWVVAKYSSATSAKQIAIWSDNAHKREMITPNIRFFLSGPSFSLTIHTCYAVVEVKHAKSEVLELVLCSPLSMFLKMLTLLIGNNPYVGTNCDNRLVFSLAFRIQKSVFWPS